MTTQWRSWMAGFALTCGISVAAFGAQLPDHPENAGAIRARVLLQVPGGYREMDTGEIYYSGERFRLKLRSDVAGYLYLVSRDNRGETRLVYPTPADGDNRIRRRTTRAIPERDFFRFDNVPGTERLWVIVSPRQIPVLERAARGSGALQPDSLVEQIAESFPSSDRQLDRFDEADGRTVLPLRLIHLSR